MRMLLVFLFILITQHTILHGQYSEPLLAEIVIRKKIEVPKTPVQKKTRKELRREKRKLKKRKRTKYKITKTKQRNKAWNGSLTAGLIGLFLLLALPATIAFLSYWGISLAISPILLVLLILSVGIIALAVYIGLLIGSPILVFIGMSDLKKNATANTGGAGAVVVISAIYLALIAFICLFFAPLGLGALILQGLLMLPGVLGLIFGLMRIIREIPVEKRERHNYYDGYDY